MINMRYLLIAAALLVGCGAPAQAPPAKDQLIVFTATWCSVCKEQKPIVDQIEARGVIVIRVDVDKHPELAQQYQVTSLPTYFYTHGGETVSGHSAQEILAQIP